MGMRRCMLVRAHRLRARRRQKTAVALASLLQDMVVSNQLFTSLHH